MTQTGTGSPTELRDVLYEFSLAKDVPDAELIDEYVRRYPEHAVVLTDFAIELVIDRLRGDEAAEDGVDPANVSPMVSRAMSRFENKLHAVEAEKAAQVVSLSQQAPTAAAAVVNPFAGLARAAFRALAQRLNVNALFLCKLRDREIDPKTMTCGFKRHVAKELEATVGVVSEHRTSLEVVTEHFAGQPQAMGTQSQFYKADQKPEPGAQQSFEEAVRSSQLTEEQQRWLLSL